MLQNLSIQDFILIEKLDLDFEDGFCVITGETGAGKSILLDAILFAMGDKSNGQIVRCGQEKAIVTLTLVSVIKKILVNTYFNNIYPINYRQSGWDWFSKLFK